MLAVLAITLPVLAFLLVVGLLYFGVKKLLFRRPPPGTGRLTRRVAESGPMRGCASPLRALGPLLAGCVLGGADGLAELARELRQRGVDPAAVVVPFEITDEMRAWVHAQVPDSGCPPSERLDRLLAAIVDPSRLGLPYEAGHTNTAREAFETRKANCLAFTSLFVGLARELGMPAFYLGVDDVERFERDGDLMVVSGHVSAGFGVGGGKMKILEFINAARGRVPARPAALGSDGDRPLLLQSRRRAAPRRPHGRGPPLAAQGGGDRSRAGRRLGQPGGRAAARRATSTAPRPPTGGRWRSIPRPPPPTRTWPRCCACAGKTQEAGRAAGARDAGGRAEPLQLSRPGGPVAGPGPAGRGAALLPRAMRLNREDAEPYAALGLAALAGGDRGEARKWLRKAASLGPGERAGAAAGRGSRRPAAPGSGPEDAVVTGAAPGASGSTPAAPSPTAWRSIPRGSLHRAKVLSTSAVRGRIAEPAGPATPSASTPAGDCPPDSSAASPSACWACDIRRDGRRLGSGAAPSSAWTARSRAISPAPPSSCAPPRRRPSSPPGW